MLSFDFISRRLRLVALLLTAACGPLAMHSTATAQTVDGANTFLSRVAEQGGLKMWRSWPGVTSGFDGGQYGRNCSSGCQGTAWRPVSVSAALIGGQCVTDISHAAPEGYPYGVGSLAWAPYAQTRSARIDWSKITLVTIAPSEPNRIRLTGTMSDGIDSPSFVLDTPELANRVKTAMEVLRSSCDPLGETGF